MSQEKVAIVTGANKGIGYGIVKGLCEKYDGVVYLTCRHQARGEKALKSLKSKGLKPEFHLLDVDNDESILKFKEYIEQRHGGIDLLVNNAAVAFPKDSKDPISVQAEATLKTNYFGLLTTCHMLFPLLRQNAQVVNLSSCCGHLSKIPSAKLKKELANKKLTESRLSELMMQFIKSTQDGTNMEKGWGSSTYAVSKVGVCALTRIQQRKFDSEKPNRNISVNSVHPGHIETDMTLHKGELPVDEGVKAPLYLSLESHGLKGQFIWSDNTVVDWLAANTPDKVVTVKVKGFGF